MDKVLIKDIAEVVNGSTPSTKENSYWDGNIPWITPKDLSAFSGRYISSGERNITKEGYLSCSTTLVPKNTILLTSRAPIGYLAIAKNDLCTNQGFKSLICNQSKVLPLYLFYWLSTKIEFLKSISGGATFKELSKTSLENVVIDLPNIAQQQHIVDTIGTIDDLIENKETLNKKLKQFSTELYESYQLLDSSKTQLSIKECCKIKTGKLNADACEVNGRYPFFTCSREQSLINSYAFDTQAIIIAGNGDINCKFYKGKFNAYQRTYVLEPQSYFFLFLKQCEASINELKKISQGSVIKFITKPMLEKITIQLNDYALSANLNIGKVYLEMFNNSFEISKLKEIKALLLKKYF